MNNSKIRFYFTENSEEQLINSKAFKELSGTLDKNKQLVGMEKDVYFLTEDGDKLLIGEVINRLEDFTNSLTQEDIHYSWFIVSTNQFVFKSSLYGYVEWLRDSFQIIEGYASKYEAEIANAIYCNKQATSQALMQVLINKIDTGIIIVDVR